MRNPSPTPRLPPDDDDQRAGTQFGLSTIFVTLTMFGVLFGICSACHLPPAQVLAAFGISAVTALVMIAILHSFTRRRARRIGFIPRLCPYCGARNPQLCARCVECAELM